MAQQIIIAYVPVLHSGYMSFFQKHAGSLYLIGAEIISELAKENPYYGRDIRALSAEMMKEVIDSLKLLPEVRVLDFAVIEELKKTNATIIVPDEDISRAVISKYFPGADIDYEQVFLRWDKVISQRELEVSPDRVVSSEEADIELMTQAKEEAGRSSDWWRQIGALVVKEGKVLLAAHNEHLPSSHSPYIAGDPRNNFNAGERIDLCTAIHAEANLIAAAAKKGMPLAGASIYVTTFPCPNCARLIAQSGIKKVYYKDGYSLLDAEEIIKDAGGEIILVKNI